MPNNQRKGVSTGWNALTTLIYSSRSVLVFLSPLHSLPTSSLCVLSVSTSLSFTPKNKTMVRTKPDPEEIDMKPFSQLSKQQGMKGTGRGEKWTGEDRRALFMYVERHGAGNWIAAAASVPGKTAKQVRSHASDLCSVVRLTR